MLWSRVSQAVVFAGVAILLGCSTAGTNFVAKDEPWREAEENSCNAAGAVRPSPVIQSRAALGGPSVCGALRPFEMSGALGGRVAMNPPALLRCPMIPQVERWVAESVAPLARYHLGSPVVGMKVAASYACRPIDNIAGGRLSEHGYANALDISLFELADGRKITVKGGWYGSDRERAFLRAVHNGACRQFTTVLGPDADSYHRDHFHMDLARHGRGGMHRVCQ